MGSFSFYVRNVAPSVTAGDAGEFMTAAATLSIPHAPSYPLYTVLSRSFMQMIPWACVPYRLNVFSAFTSALALTFLYLAALQMGASFWMAFLTAAVFGLSTSFWENSLVTEVFSLNSLWAALFAFLLALSGKSQVNSPSHLRTSGLIAFLLGLGLGNHQILVVFVPVFLLYWFIQTKGKMKRALAGAVIFGLLGYSIYLILPLRSSREPPLNWGRPTTVHKLYRTITRKDYGSLKLSIGDAPERDVKNTVKQLTAYIKQQNKEIPGPIAVAALMGLIWGIKRKAPFYLSVLTLFVLSGPLFYVFSNLPFNAQSEGIMGRFFIMPTMALCLGFVELGRLLKKAGPLLLVSITVFLFVEGKAEAANHRKTSLVYDYGQAMLRALPPGSVLFLDGGDDAFYSLAMLHYVLNKRSDVEIHDRGGLIYKNVYGDDFRQIPKDMKTIRRQEVESSYLGRKHLFYSTMDKRILPNLELSPVGFLYEARMKDERRITWPLIILRSLYPLAPHNYRTRALAAFFPYMQGKALMAEGNLDEGLRYFRRACRMGYDVDWLRTNVAYEYANLAYDFLKEKRYPLAEKVYRQWIAYDPDDYQAQSNLGVALEKMGRLAEAHDQYEKTAQRFPQAPDPVYNLAVLYWHKKDWPAVVRLLEEVLRRDSHHANARSYLPSAKEKMTSHAQ